MDGRIRAVDGGLRPLGAAALLPGLQAHPPGQAVQPVRPAPPPPEGGHSADPGPTEGAAGGLPSTRQGGPRPLLHLLGLPLLHHQLPALHIRRLHMAGAFLHAADRYRGADIRVLPGHPGGYLLRGAGLGGRPPVAGAPAPAHLRPDTEEGVGGDPAADHLPDGADSPHGGVPRGVGRGRRPRVCPSRLGPGRPLRRRGGRPRAGRGPAEPLLVAAPRGDPGILPVHPAVEAHAHRGRAHQLPDPPPGAQGHPLHPPGPGDGG